MFHVYGGWIFCVIFYTFSTHRRSQHPPWTATPNKGFTPQSQRAKKKNYTCVPGSTFRGTLVCEKAIASYTNKRQRSDDPDPYPTRAAFATTCAPYENMMVFKEA